MSNINFNRRAHEEAIKRRHHRDRADRLEGLRPRFERWMREQGFSEQARAEGLNQLEDHVALNDMMSQGGDVD